MSYLIATLVLAGLGLALAALAGATSGHQPAQTPTRRPQTPRLTTRRDRLKAYLRCLQGAHDDVYTFRLGRPCYRCRVCRRWRKHEVLVDFPRERRA